MVSKEDIILSQMRVTIIIERGIYNLCYNPMAICVEMVVSPITLVMLDNIGSVCISASRGH